MELTALVEAVGLGVDLAGVIAIAGGILWVTLVTLPRLRLRAEPAYDDYRRGIGKAILLGLELLVAADIIRTVAISPTFENVAVLGLIILIRTFLSFSLEVEIYGRWPWQRGRRLSNRDA